MGRRSSLYQRDEPDRPEVGLADVASDEPRIAALSPEVREQVEIEVKYGPYVERAREDVARFRKLEDRPLPDGIDYGALVGLRRESAEKLARVRPTTVGQASRISGVSPADVSILLVHVRRLEAAGKRD